MKEYYFIRFIKAGKLRHIAQKGGVLTLCRNYFNNSDSRFSGPIIIPVDKFVKGNERYKKGRDCKACFRKAKLNIGGIMEYKDLYFTQPLLSSRMYHIFGKDNRSLCGDYGMLRRSKELCTDITGKEKYKKGQDCKKCFRKAKLKIPEGK